MGSWWSPCRYCGVYTEYTCWYDAAFHCTYKCRNVITCSSQRKKVPPMLLMPITICCTVAIRQKLLYQSAYVRHIVLFRSQWLGTPLISLVSGFQYKLFDWSIVAFVLQCNTITTCFEVHGPNLKSEMLLQEGHKVPRAQYCCADKYSLRVLQLFSEF